jgi:hypothetical protein
MLKRIQREARIDAGIGSPFHSSKAASEQPPKISNVIPFRCARGFQQGRGPDRNKNVNELEAENAQLQISAIQLALEIQKLRQRRCR